MVPTLQKKKNKLSIAGVCTSEEWRYRYRVHQNGPSYDKNLSWQWFTEENG